MVRWDPSQVPGQEIMDDYEYDGGNSSSRLFERSRIKALAGNFFFIIKNPDHFPHHTIVHIEYYTIAIFFVILVKYANLSR